MNQLYYGEINTLNNIFFYLYNYEKIVKLIICDLRN